MVLRCVLSCLLVAAVCAADAPPAPGSDAPAADGAGRSDPGRRWLADDPSLKGVDPNTPEGKERYRTAMEKRMEQMAPRIRQRISEGQAAQHAEIKTRFAMAPDEWAAVEPLLNRVETLALQRGILERGNGPWAGGRRGGGEGGGLNPQLLLGDTALDPAAQEVLDAGKAFRALVNDQQANEAELSAGMERLRKAKTAFQAVQAKAQEALKSVLTQRQEALLVDRGLME